jgi:acetyl-CoA synthetase
MEFSEAKALITVDGARRKGKTAPIKQQVDEVMGDLDSIETIVVVKRDRRRREMKDGRDVWYHEALEAADDECPAEPLDAEHPLYILYTSGSTAKPKGILHTTGGYLTGVALHAPSTSSTSSPRRTSTGARPTSAGSPGTPTSSTGRWPTARRR